MRKLTYFIAATLDGFVAGPEGQTDFIPFDGDFAEAIMSEYPDTLPVHARAALGLSDAPNKHFDTVVMGRHTYDPGLALGITSPYSHLKQYVFSRSLTDPDPDVEIVAGDPVELVRGLKRQDGTGIWLCGGPQLAGQLIEEIDELVVKRNPIVIGTGLPLFAEPFSPRRFTLTGTRTFDTGVAIQTYVPEANS